MADISEEETPDIDGEDEGEVDDLVLDDDDDAVVDDADLDVDLDALVAEPIVGAVVGEAGTTPTAEADDEEDENLDLEEELHPDDVEEPLDVLLAERTTAERMDEEEADLEDEDLEPENPADGGGKIVPRRDDEFLCRSCFLVKPLSQLAKGEKDLCRDCE